MRRTSPDPSPAHEAKESAAMERYEHRTGKEAQDERTGKARKDVPRGARKMKRGLR